MQLRVLTLKPQIDIVEYGVTTADHAATPTDEVPSQTGWIVHGAQLTFTLNAEATGAEIIAAATEDAITRGYLPAP